MAKTYGERSEHLVKNENKFSFYWKLGVLILFTLVFSIILYFSFNLINSNVNSYVVTFLLILFLAFIKKLGKGLIAYQKFSKGKAINFFEGRKGEEEVLNVLRELSEDYIVFYDINLYARGNIDFVVLGPCGLLAIEVKSYKGKITYWGGKLLRDGFKIKEKEVLRQTMTGALDLNCYLKEKLQKNFFVTPVLVFSDKYASVRFGLNPVGNVFVVQKDYLIKLIEALPEAISREEAIEIERELSLLYK